VPLRRDAHGYHSETVEGVPAGTRYLLRLDGGEGLPDPASRAQPEGVHGPSEVVDPRAFAWSDHDWRGLPLRELVMYELHVGTFTPEGTFDAVIRRLPHLVDLGITVL
jgi:maltooligosyltrehalose trehalohydrolase